MICADCKAEESPVFAGEGELHAANVVGADRLHDQWRRGVLLEQGAHALIATIRPQGFPIEVGIILERVVARGEVAVG